DKQFEDLVARYKKRLAEKLGGEEKLGEAVKEKETGAVISKEYETFKEELLPIRMSLYEKACNQAEKIFKISPDKNKAPLIQKDIDAVHLQITPTGVYSFSILAPLTIMFIGVALSIFLPALFGSDPSMFFILGSLMAGAVLIYPMQQIPKYIANSWRMEASNQMVLCIFYIVTYMRHTSNLERALEFAADHLTGPLALDLKKVLWDVETNKYENVKESLDTYLETWKETNFEFVEAFHLIESSLYEGSETRRISLLDKSLDVILEETYEKMLHYAQNLKDPITTLHMLGIILPILGLVILPLIVSFMAEVRWYHIAAIYNLALPLAVYIMGRTILTSRPTGYGDVDISEEHPELKKYKNIIIPIGKTELQFSPLFLSIFVGVLCLAIAMIPIMMHTIGVPDIGFGTEDKTTDCGYQYCILDYRTDSSGNEMGPFSLIATILSFLIPLGVGLGIGLYYKTRSQNVMKIRDESKKLEQEFASGLFQLGNRLGDGIPAEIAFPKVAGVMEGTETGKFFSIVSDNINQMGMSVERALFDPKRGATLYYPSKMIESSMKVLTESAKKGPQIAAQAVINVSRYIKEMHRVDERLKDLLAEIISSMKSQISFMTPVIAGIVVGITSMISNILAKLGPMLQQQQVGAAGVGGAGSLPTDLFGLGIPSFHFQAIVGIYVIQITFILTILANGIENGADKLNEKFLIGKNLVYATLLYVGIALIITIIFNTVAVMVLQGVIA
ncbi:hypothetical protein HZA99_05705, partial [Candidatus Woesearchaeota archaeon]|nr:hypothetical protein [Candidatus Woesearchaeota archaeon]